jgi:hypothetical protein
MINVIVSLALGSLLYAVILLKQPADKRSDSDTWKDYLGISFVCSLALLGFLFLYAIGLGPNASGTSIIETSFNPPRNRGIWIPYVGFAAVAFTTCAALHVVVLRFAGRRGNAG